MPAPESSNNTSSSNDFYGGAATNARPITKTTFNVIADYPWTLNTNLRKQSESSLKEIPYVYLTEYEVDESTIKTQISFYLNQAKNTISGSTDLLSPYEEMFPRKSTENVYIFPYFSEKNYEINTPMWVSLDTLEQGQKFIEGAAGVIGGPNLAGFVSSGLKALGSAAGATLGAIYPKIGIFDRPKLWSQHEYRTIEIRFPLFNTVDPDDWKKNSELCWTLVNQNLFAKIDFITGIPPVYYEVLIPGQHYSYASCVTNLTIYNRGNMRTLTNRGNTVIVPDAYEVSMTLTDMVMPSRNLFRSIDTKSKEVVVTKASTSI